MVSGGGNVPLMRFAVEGVRVGHWTDSSAETGCTVIELPPGTVASYEARGGAPASRELTALEPDKAAATVDAVVLTGGSAFGLAAADGVMRYYEELGRGVAAPAGPVPIVPTMALYDLAVGDGTVRPTAADGYAAARNSTSDQVLCGRIGVGAGAYVSHWRGAGGRRPSGLGYAEQRLGDVVVGALCAVNAYGDVASAHTEASLDAVEALQRPFDFGAAMAHTTIGVVVTNARLSKIGCRIVAQGAHDGLSRALTPPHTRYDGDAFVAAATCEVDCHVDVVRLLALVAATDAIRSVAAANNA